MKFCDDHWSATRRAVDDRALSHLIAKDGAVAVQQMQQQLQDGGESRETFDPLMSVHWAIVNNVMRMLGDAGMNPLYLLSGGPEDAVEGYPAYEGRTWPRCPLCYINLAHEITCAHQNCRLDKARGYDWTIDRAAQDALDRARELGLVGAAS